MCTFKSILFTPARNRLSFFVYWTCVVDFSVFELNGAKVIVDDISVDLIKGSTIDFEEELARYARRLRLYC
jgi:hypothetical protein